MPLPNYVPPDTLVLFYKRKKALPGTPIKLQLKNKVRSARPGGCKLVFTAIFGKTIWFQVFPKLFTAQTVLVLAALFTHMLPFLFYLAFMPVYICPFLWALLIHLSLHFSRHYLIKHVFAAQHSYAL